MERAKPDTSNLMDTHERLIADILTRYRTLLMLTTTHVSGEPSADLPSSASVSAISLRMEFDGLYASVKELLTLSRRMKELWAFGPLGGRDGEEEKKVEGDVRKVIELLGQVEGGRLRDGAEKLGGRWEELRVGEMGFGQQAQSQNTTQTQTQSQAQTQGQSQPQTTASGGAAA